LLASSPWTLSPSSPSSCWFHECPLRCCTTLFRRLPAEWKKCRLSSYWIGQNQQFAIIPTSKKSFSNWIVYFLLHNLT
jgi:hypothetical protein